jgi:DNA replication and repair protein RecF
MLLDFIEAHNFRNLSGKVAWGPGLNIIYGHNAQGKTNWLEAIYILATTKSFRTQRLQETLRFSTDLAVIRGQVTQSQEVQRDLQITLNGNNKATLINGKRETLSRYLGKLHAVAFTADELEIVRGGPDARRRFIDRGVVSLHPAYVQTLADYNRVIKQKNRLLQTAAESQMNMEQIENILAPWNEQLATLASAIHRARVDYVEQLKNHLDPTFFGREDLSIRYVSALEDKGDLSDYEGLIRERLKIRLQAEIGSGYSLVGPHRDELEIRFDGKEMRAFGSSGQQRSALIILDLAAISLYHLWHNEYPLFLLDDVDAELDWKRIGHLLEYLDGRTQTFITTSKESLVEQFVAKASVYRISEGKVADDDAELMVSSSATSAESI